MFAHAKLAAVPIACGAVGALGTIDKTVEPDHRAEIKAKLANFVRAPWFAPPFGGPQLTNLILNAFEAMEQGQRAIRCFPIISRSTCSSP